MEHQHYNLYYNTNILFVISKEGNKITAISPAGQQKYKIKDIHNKFQPSDTIWLNNDYWVFNELRFINK